MTAAASLPQASADVGTPLVPKQAETLEPQWWFSPSRMKITLACAVLGPCATTLVCYFLWLMKGCAPFMPFISDFGMRAGGFQAVFATGLAVSAIPLAVTFIDVFLIRQLVLHSLASTFSEILWSLWNIAMLFFGLADVFCIGSLGFRPWDTHVSQHLQLATGIVVGGPVLMLLNVVFSTYLRFALKCGIGYPWIRALQAYVSVQSVLAMVSTLIWLRVGGNTVDFMEQLSMAHDDFHKYCQSSTERMSTDALNKAALSEWILVGSLLGSVATAYLDIEIYTRMKLDGTGLPM